MDKGKQQWLHKPMPTTEGFGLSLPKELLPAQSQPTSLSLVSALFSLLLLKLCQQKSIERCLFGNKTNPWLTGRDIRYLHARETAHPFRVQLHTDQVYLKGKSQAIAGYELAKKRCVGVRSEIHISDVIKWRANSSLSYIPVFLYLFLGCSTHLHAWPPLCCLLAHKCCVVSLLRVLFVCWLPYAKQRIQVGFLLTLLPLW